MSITGAPIATTTRDLNDLVKQNIPNANEFSVSPDLEYVVPAGSGLQT